MTDPGSSGHSPVERYRAEGRIKIDAMIVRGAPHGWFKPGAGRSEWLKDHELGPEMVVVPAGSFMMGSPATEFGRECWQDGTEGPQHKVTIAKPFAVGRHAVTRGQFAAFVDDTGHNMPGGAIVTTGTDWGSTSSHDDPDASWRNPGFAQDDSHPVVCVIRVDARAYAAWLSRKTGKNYRLLLEAEWEYVTRAGTTTPFWWGASISTARANYDGNYAYSLADGAEREYRRRTVPADSFEANPWGLFNVHGNVRELCADGWHDNYDGAPSDGSAWAETGNASGSLASLHVVRGGDWDSYPHLLRSAFRLGVFPIRGNRVGFRVARTCCP